MARTKSSAGTFTRAGQFVVYLLFRAMEGVLRWLPLTLCARVGRLFGGIAYLLMGGARRLALANLEIAFGREHDLPWLKKTARAHFQSLGQNLLCSLKLPLMSESDVAARVTVEGMEHARATGGGPVTSAVELEHHLHRCPRLQTPPHPPLAPNQRSAHAKH